MLGSHSPSASSWLLSVNKEGDSVREPSYLEGQETLPSAPRSKAFRWYSRKKIVAASVIIAVTAIFLVVFLPVFFVVIRKNNSRSTGGSRVPNPNSPSGAIVSLRRQIFELAVCSFLVTDRR